MRASTIALGTLTATCSAIPIYLVAALAPRLQADLGFDDAALGFAIGAFFAVSAVVTVRAGRLADRYGWWPLAAGGCAGTAGVLLVLAFAGDRYLHLVLALAVAGLAFGVAQPSSSLVLLRDGPRRGLGMSFGVKQAGIPAATLVSGAALPLIAVRAGWRPTIAAVAVLVAAFVLVLLARGGGPSADPPRTDAARRAAAGAGTPEGIVRYVLAAAVMTAVVASVAGFSVVALVAAGLSESSAGVVLATCSLLGIAARIVGGWLVDRWSFDGIRLSGFLIAASSAGYACIAVGRPAPVVAGVAVAYVVGWSWPGILFHGIVSAYPAQPGAAAGALQTGLSLGNTVGPVMFGSALRAFGGSPAWLGIGVLAVVAGATMIFARASALRTAATRATT